MRTSLFFLALMAPGLAAALPATLQHQGLLRDATGVPLNGTEDVTFRLYTVRSGGLPLWEETQALDFEQGYFTATLGGSSALDPATLNLDAMFLALQVGNGPELDARVDVTSVPFAMHAHLASSVTGDVNATSVVVGGTTVIDSDGAIDFSALINVPPAPDVLRDLGCVEGDIARFSGSDWVCATDSDAMLTETEVETFVTNGTIDLAQGSTLDGVLLPAGWADLPDKPTGLADDVDDDLLATLLCTPGQIAVMTDGVWDCANGIDEVSEADIRAIFESTPVNLEMSSLIGLRRPTTDWSDLANLPAAFADNTDGDVLAALPCTLGQRPKMGALDWECAADADVFLSDVEVRNFIENGDLNVVGSLDVRETAQLAGNTVLGEPSTFNQRFQGSLTTNHGLNVDGGTEVASSTVLGDAASDSHRVYGGVTVNQTLNVDGDALLKSNTTLGDNGADSHTARGTVNMKQNLTVVGTGTVQETLRMTTPASLSLSNPGSLHIGAPGGTHIAIEQRHIQARVGTAAGPLYIQSGSGATDMGQHMWINENATFGDADSDSHTLAGTLDLKNTRDVSLSQSGALMIGATNTYNLSVDGNEIQARNNGAASTLYFQGSGGRTNIGGGGLEFGLVRTTDCSAGGNTIVPCYCPAGLMAVGGGVDCDGGESVQRSHKVPNHNGWVGECDNGTTQVWVMCALVAY